MRLTLAVGLFLAPLVALLPAQPADPATTDDVQDVVLLGESRPFFFRLHIRADGKPFAAPWEAFIGALFDYFDRDGDGTLDKDEAARLPSPQQLALYFQGNATLDRQPAAPPFAELDADNDGKVSREELIAYYRNSEGGPFQLAAGQNSTGDAVAVTAALFVALDRDRDGRLSREELEAAPGLLARFDSDDDEVLTPAEVLERPAQAARQPTDPPIRLLALPRDAARRVSRRLRFAKDVLTHYDRDRDGKLSRAEIGLPPALFDRLDLNKDGALDAVELLRWLLVSPDATATCRIGAESATLEMDGAAAGPSFLAGDAIVRFQCTPGRGRSAVNLLQFYRDRFREADEGGKGSLTLRDLDVRKHAFLRSMFALMDRDDDGRLTAAEVDAWANLVEQGVGRAIRATLIDRGRGLFELLDANGDGRLGLRELRGAWKRVAPFDADGDGHLSLTEIPRQMELLVTRADGGNAASGRAGPPARGPLWFRKMDRNRDGDVSRREFLGSDADFRRLDADGDGLISVEEAERADADLRRLRRK